MRPAAATLALVAAVLLPGCSVEHGGGVGLTVEDAEVVALVLPCIGYLDGVLGYQQVGPGGQDDDYAELFDRTLGARVEAGETERLVLEGVGASVGAGDGVGLGVPVTVEGYTVDNRWRATGPSIGDETLTSLVEGEVLYTGFDEKGSYGTFTVPEEEFLASYCNWQDY